MKISDFFAGEGMSDEVLERALALEDFERPVSSAHRPSMIGGVLMIGTGQFERARRLHGRLYTWISERGEESSLPFLAGFLAWTECSRGDLAAAERFAKEGLDASLRLGSESMQAWNRAFGGLAAAVGGNVSHARSNIEESLRLLRRAGWSWGLNYASAAPGFLGLSLGNAAGTAAALREATARVETEGPSRPLPFGPFLPCEVEALIALRDFPR